MLPLRAHLTIAAALGLALASAPHSASADASPADCGVVDVQYDVSANLKITDTVMGAGDGVYRIGPGKVVLRFDDRKGRRHARLLSYDLRQSFTVVAKALLWTTRVSTDIQTRAYFAPSLFVAEGTLGGSTLRWDGQANGVRSDGTLRCEGSMCGKFGAPPSGISEIHTGPSSIALKPFEFAGDMKTFTMPFAVLSESEVPKERTLVSMAGREVKRACVSGAVPD
jgi:hypothetical protein